jgi:hypothetical protein
MLLTAKLEQRVRPTHQRKLMPMSIQSVFGQLLLSVSERLRNLAARLGTKVTGQGYTTGGISSRVLIWDVIDGPYSREEFDEDVLYEDGIPEDLNAMLVVKLEEDGKVGTVNFWYETEEEAMMVKQYFKSNIEPLEVT